jgi:flagellar hook-associated protein 3 FlgL
MTVQRVTTQSLFNQTIGNVLSTQASLYSLQDQISSGLKSKTFQGLNGQVEQYVGLGDKITKINNLIQNNQLATLRLKTADQALSSMISTVDNIEDLIVTRRGPAAAENLNFEEQMRNLRELVAENLNTSVEGRYLFGGTRTDSPPMPNAHATTITKGVLDTNYYDGAAESVTYRTDENTVNNFPVRGDDVAFQQIFTGINLAIEGHRSGSDPDLAAALTMIQEGMNGLNTAQTKVNSSIINIDNINTRLGQSKLYFQGVSEQIIKTDVVAASTQLANDEAILQASYQAFTRLAQLRLSDFLR